MHYSTATIDDIPALCGLLEELFRQEVEFQPDKVAQSRGLSRIIRDPEKGHVLVAREGGDIVAMVCLLYTVSTALGARVALLEDMVVAPAGRGKNIGSLLIEFALGFAREQGCKRITLLTDADNSGAHRFYQRHGFELSSMRPFRISLD